MLLRIPSLLTQDELKRCRGHVAGAAWADGRITAGSQSQQVKLNRQLADDDPAAHEARAIVLAALARNALFFTAALPKKIYPPLFNRYEGAANRFGNHIDNAVRTVPGTALHVRTDLAATLFLSDPDDYDGGELVIEHSFGIQGVKLPAGDMVLYPASSVHRVEPVTRGARLASFFWVESMVRDAAERTLLFDLDVAIRALRQGTPEPAAPAAEGSDADALVRLTGIYHNLVRMWSET